MYVTLHGCLLDHTVLHLHAIKPVSYVCLISSFHAHRIGLVRADIKRRLHCMLLPEYNKCLCSYVCQVSGARFWKLFQQLCITPDNFFRRCFVHNMCPWLFLCLSGKNLTPPDLPATARQQLNTTCDRALIDVLRLLGVRTVVAVGKYAQCRVRTALRDAADIHVNIAVIMHPSPANPAANQAWSEIALAQLTQAGLIDRLR